MPNLNQGTIITGVFPVLRVVGLVDLKVPNKD
jgi:hypothetical protein